MNNVIVNGSFDFFQRGSVFHNPPDLTYVADQWGRLTNNGSSCDFSKKLDGPFPGDNCLNIKVTNPAPVIGASQYEVLFTRIEGYQFRSFVSGFGTLSMWVKSNVTGIYCVSVNNMGADQAWVGEFTIDSANTWEQKEIPINFNFLGGTWNYNIGLGMQFCFTLASGSNFHCDTPEVWQSRDAIASHNQVNFVGCVGNEFNITRARFQKGMVATDFEVIPYDIELRRCQRYYEKSYFPDMVPGTSNSTNLIHSAWQFGANNFQTNFIKFQVPKRVVPAIKLYANTGESDKWEWYTAAGTTSKLSSYVDSPSEKGFHVYQTSQPVTAGFGHWAAEARIY